MSDSELTARTMVSDMPISKRQQQEGRDQGYTLLRSASDG